MLTTSVIDQLPDDVFKVARKAMLDTDALHYAFAHSHNHDTLPFTYWFINHTGTTDANRKPLDPKEFLQPEYLAVWDYVAKAVVPGAKLIRALSYIHTFEQGRYPHISLMADPEVSTVTVALNKEWDIEWDGDTILMQQDGLRRSVEKVLPEPGRVLAFPTTTPHEVRLTRNTRQSRYSLAFRVTA